MWLLGPHRLQQEEVFGTHDVTNDGSKNVTTNGHLIVSGGFSQAKESIV
jgi:hypothetical protein